LAVIRKKEKKFMRLFNTISVIAQKIATTALDRPQTFAALTRAHTGLAELRPPRSHSKQSSKLSSPPLRGTSLCIVASSAIVARCSVVAPLFRHCERSEAIQCGAAVLDCFVAEPVIGPATSGRTRWLLAMTRFLNQIDLMICIIAHPKNVGGRP